jgi:hypothetical protein
MENNIMNKYRFESGSAYIYCSEHKAFVFIGKLNGRTKAQFIKEYEQLKDE